MKERLDVLLVKTGAGALPGKGEGHHHVRQMCLLPDSGRIRPALFLMRRQ